MVGKKSGRSVTRRTQVKELPKQQKELGKDEQKKIKGGPTLMSWMPGAKPGGGN